MRWIASALFLVLVGCSSAEPVPDGPVAEVGDEPAFDSAGRFTIVYTNNVDGEIEPCG